MLLEGILEREDEIVLRSALSVIETRDWKDPDVYLAFPHSRNERRLARVFRGWKHCAKHTGQRVNGRKSDGNYPRWNNTACRVRGEIVARDLLSALHRVGPDMQSTLRVYAYA